MAPHSSTLAWKIPWMEVPGGLQSMGSIRVGHDWTTSLSHTGEGNGNPLQCSCLENPRDGGAWWAAIYGVAQSQTRLKRFSSSSKPECNLVTDIERLKTPVHNFLEVLSQTLIVGKLDCIFPVHLFTDRDYHIERNGLKGNQIMWCMVCVYTPQTARRLLEMKYNCCGVLMIEETVYTCYNHMYCKSFIVC